MALDIKRVIMLARLKHVKCRCVKYAYFMFDSIIYIQGIVVIQTTNHIYIFNISYIWPLHQTYFSFVEIQTIQAILHKIVKVDGIL